MRVTNERAKSALKAHHITGNMTKIIKEYATDLLEARELIKEMRVIFKRFDDEVVSSLSPLERMEVHAMVSKSKGYT